MGATTFFMYEQDRARAAKKAGKKVEAEHAEAEAHKRLGTKMTDQDPTDKSEDEVKEPVIIDPAADNQALIDAAFTDDDVVEPGDSEPPPIEVDVDGDGEPDIIIKTAPKKHK